VNIGIAPALTGHAIRVLEPLPLLRARSRDRSGRGSSRLYAAGSSRPSSPGTQANGVTATHLASLQQVHRRHGSRCALTTSAWEVCRVLVVPGEPANTPAIDADPPTVHGLQTLRVKKPLSIAISLAAGDAESRVPSHPSPH
jgi:hypothetical protein